MVLWPKNVSSLVLGLLADKAYDADERVRYKLAEKGCMAVIPSKSNRKNPSSYDKNILQRVTLD